MKLKPPLNYRWIDRRCCVNCKYWIGGEFADWQCKRDPENIAGDWNSLEPEFHVCDRWVNNIKTTQDS